MEPTAHQTCGLTAAEPNEQTLLHTAGDIRSALQELTTALDGLADGVSEDPEAVRQVSLALRSVYRLRRTALTLELFAQLRAGTYRLDRRNCRPAAMTAVLCGELRELLQSAGIELSWKLPDREIPLYVDEALLADMLRELVVNAASDARDGRVRLTLSRAGEDRLCFTVENRPAAPLPERPFQRHREEQTDLRTGKGLGLSLVSAAAACHGGSLLLSETEEGTVTALLSVTGSAEQDPVIRCPVQRPMGPDAALTALSPVLPPSLYHPDDIL